MFNFVFNKDIGAGYLFLVNSTFTKQQLDVLLNKSIATIQSDSRFLGYAQFTSFKINQVSRAVNASSNVNLQVPRYGFALYTSMAGLTSVTAIRSGTIQGAVMVNNNASVAAFFTYGVGMEVTGSHTYSALGSANSTVTFNNVTSYY